MKIILAILLAAALAGCASAPMPSDPVAAQCRYEAEAATVAMPNPFLAGVRVVELFNMCMRARGR